MASLKDEREESDGDEMDHESNESDKSSSTSDSSDGSDTDDSSELDGEECERRRNECIENLAEMERQFAVLREQPVEYKSINKAGTGYNNQDYQGLEYSTANRYYSMRLYRERITQIKQKLEEVHEGVAKEYRRPLEELQDNMRIRIEVAGVLRKLRLENIENSFRAEEQAARQNLENEKVLLFDSMKEELEDKIRRLEEERNSADFHSDSFFNNEKNKSSHPSGKGRVSWRKGTRPEPGRRKPVTVSGPYIVYMLSEEDIMEDWTAIKKSLQSTKRTSTSTSSTERKHSLHRLYH